MEGSEPDWGKGSYYANPLLDILTSDAELIKKFPSFLEPNVWPSTGLPELESAFKNAGQKVQQVGCMLARLCDAHVREVLPGYHGKLEQVIRDSKCCKGRLLHYYPREVVARMSGEVDASPTPTRDDNDDDDTSFSDWCGWHNDHGSLTALIPAVYTNATTGRNIPCPDPAAGLYVRSREGRLVKVIFPEDAEDCVAFQIGETAQIHTGGVLQATPHAVRGCEIDGVSRQTFAVFMEPEHDGDMDVPEGRTEEDVQSGEAIKMLPEGCRPLGGRWRGGMDFGEFSEATFSSFY